MSVDFAFRACVEGCSHHCVALTCRRPAEAGLHSSRLAAILDQSPFSDPSTPSHAVFRDVVPAASTSADGRARILREMGRCLPDASEIVLRSVTLSFTDTDVVVLTAPRALLDRATLERIGALALGEEPLDTALESVWWDLPSRAVPDGGARTSAGTAGLRYWELPRWERAEGADPRILDVAALAHTLARHQALDSVTVGVTAPSDLPSHVLGATQATELVEAEIAPGDTVGALLRRIEEALERGVRDEGTGRPHALLTYPSSGPGTAYYPGTRDAVPFVLVPGTELAGLYAPAAQPEDDGVRRFLQDLASVRRHLACAEPDTPLADLEFLGPDEAAATLALGDGGRLPAPHGSIPGAVARRAREHPDNVAVSFENEHLTYRQLEDLAGRVAAGLTAMGVARGQTVGICVRRSAGMIGFLLGILKIGAAYVPIDIAHPAQRIAFTCEDAGVQLLIADDSDAGGQAAGLRVVSPAQLLQAPADQGADRPAPEPGVDDLAYVIYTSGSTGAPKGVGVTHGNVMSLLESTSQRMAFTADDVWSQFHSVTFDFSVWEIWGCLCSGGRLVVVPYFVARSPDLFLELLADEGVTVLNQTPTAFGELSHALADCDATSDRIRVRLVVFGGEALDPRILRTWVTSLPRLGTELVNMYGITETTVHVTSRTLGRSAILTGQRSVGRPLAGWRISVRDSYGRLLPPGIAGEIHVGGAGVATGYLNRAALTAERFVRDRYTRDRLYRTGDLGILNADGSLEYVGRIDNQVKIRGYRIELGEIRAVLRGMPELRDAAVTVAQDPDTGARIDAYLVPRDPAAGEGLVAQARGHVTRALPPYMVPGTWTLMDCLPVTINGKLDTRRLSPSVPAPSIPHQVATGTGGSADSVVRQAWQTLFGTEVSADSNFFDNGGTSLLAIRLVKLLRGHAMGSVSVRDIYRHPTISQLAAFLSEAGAAPEPAR